MRQTLAQTHTIRACDTEANLANGIWNPESENKFSVAIFLKKKSSPIKKNFDQSDSCGFSTQVRVCVRKLVRSARIHRSRESAVFNIFTNGLKKNFFDI